METLGTPGKAGSLIASDVIVLLIFVGAVVGILVAGVVIAVKLRNRRLNRPDKGSHGSHGSQGSHGSHGSQG